MGCYQFGNRRGHLFVGHDFGSHRGTAKSEQRALNLSIRNQREPSPQCPVMLLESKPAQILSNPTTKIHDNYSIHHPKMGSVAWRPTTASRLCWTNMWMWHSSKPWQSSHVDSWGMSRSRWGAKQSAGWRWGDNLRNEKFGLHDQVTCNSCCRPVRTHQTDHVSW